MKIVETFPIPFREIETAWIPMGDGCRLAARIWLPEGAEEKPVPAVLEYIPYRRRDFTRGRDEAMHRYFAGHGYAAVRVDLRGSGDSDGLLLDEYLPVEQEDGLAVIAWLAAQPWCSGAVGMIGISWGGFNGLQIAALRPPALKAVISVCSTDDRYADDVHFMGGALLIDNLAWGAVMLSYNAYPPDPAVVGDGWRETWRARLDATPPLAGVWLRHQRRDGYWKHGSVCEDLTAIECPVYAVGGWADGYSNAIPRLLAGLPGPSKGLIGPWSHNYPNSGRPGPAIGFLQEAIRWWDQWLAGRDTGIMGEPQYRVWMQDAEPPSDYYETRAGRWVTEATWPSSRIATRRYAIGAEGLGDAAGAEADLTLTPFEAVGAAAGDWCPYGAPGSLPADQREDDSHSLCFDTPPLGEATEILGAPVVEVEVAADRPSAFLAVRLNDVAPDGAATRVSFGILNLTHRDGHESPAPLEPGRRTRIRVQLNDAAHTFRAGHRIRVAVSTAYWPIVWPSPAAVTLTLRAGAGWLDLPVRAPDPADDSLPPFPPAERAPVSVPGELRAAPPDRSITTDPKTGEAHYRVGSVPADGADPTLVRIDDIDLEAGYAVREDYRIHPDDPLSAAAEVTQRTVFQRAGWRVRVDTVARMTATADAYRLTTEVRAWDGEAVFFERRWDEEVPHDLG